MSSSKEEEVGFGVDLEEMQQAESNASNKGIEVGLKSVSQEQILFMII